MKKSSARSPQPRNRSFGIIEGRAWSEKEYQVLRDHYVQHGTRACMDLLPGRSKRSIATTARRLGLKKLSPWTEKEDLYLQGEWGYSGLAAMARYLKRTSRAIYLRAVALGIKRGPPQGMESLTAAANRSGFTVPHLRRLLKEAGVPIRRVPTPPDKKRAFRHTYVDPFDVDEAVASWNATELLTSAARARGLFPERLRRWLAASGYRSPRGKKSPWRIPSATIDKVVAERQAVLEAETVPQAAARIGVRTNTLYHWMRAAGIQAGAHLGRVPRDVLDELVATRLARAHCESYETAARRHRVPVRTLRRWLTGAGVPPGPRRSLDPAVVDRVVAERRQRSAA